MSGKFVKDVKILLVLTIVLSVVNCIIGYQYDLSLTFILTSYLFFFILNCIILYTFDWVARNHMDKSGFLFISFMFLKAILIIGFLLAANGSAPISKVLMLNFALIYLAYLFYSMHACLKTLNFYQK